MRTVYFFLLIIFFVLPVYSQDTTWLTDYEKSACRKTPRYDETIEFCKKLDDVSSWIRFTDFGISPRGRKLPMLIMDLNGHFDEASAHSSGNIIVLVQACIHAGESDGKDAVLMLIRDIVMNGKYTDMMKHITLLFIPIFNVDGHERFGPYNRINQNGPEEMGWRTTAQNFNLNRDYLKADAPEMMYWLKMYNTWRPDFFIDCHTTDGADYQYSLTYDIETDINMDDHVSRWIKKTYLPDIVNKMSEAGFLTTEYVSFRQWHDPRSGLISNISPPMLSTGYTTLHNRPGLLIETHMLKDYKTRVTSTYEMVRYSLELLDKDRMLFKETLKKADDYTSSPAFRQNDFPVTFNMSQDSQMVDFLGYEYRIEKSDLSGGNWFIYSDKPQTFRVPKFCFNQPDEQIKLPEAYVVPPEWIDIIERIKANNISFFYLKKSEKIKINTYLFRNPEWQDRPYEGRLKITRLDIDEITEEIEFPAGSIVIDMNQRTAKIVAHMLEPKSPDSFLRWGYFNTIFEQKEYAESYKMEVLAREMLKDEQIKKEFEKAKTENKELMSNSWNILNWFFQHSSYSDENQNKYPIGKMYNREAVNRLR